VKVDNGTWTKSAVRSLTGRLSGAVGRTTLALVVTLASAGAAWAQGAEAFDYSRFEPQPTQGSDLLNVSSSELLGHLRFAAGLFFLYEDDPLTVVQDADHSAVVSRAVDQRVVGEIALAFGLFDRFSLAVAMPFVLTQGGGDLELFGRPGESIGGAAPGELRVIPKVLVLAPDDFGGFGLHLLCPITIPTGDDDSFLSDGGVGATPTLGLDFRTEGGVVVALNAGYRLRPKRVAYNYVSDDAIEWGLGLKVPIVEPLALVGTAFGSVDTAKSLDPSDFTSEVSDTGLTVEGALAVQLELGAGLAITAGAGGALVRGVGSPDFRAFLGIDWSSGKGPQDGDGDGIFDPDDKCPDQPEDVDGFEDHDGCPDLDDDQDGVPDAGDGCPREAEDMDGFQDEDGCPDPDNDGDGVGDLLDKCPTEKEDRDGFEDDDGCPDLDNDQDGVPDAVDKCPDEAEDMDGLADADGCPEADADEDGVPDEKDKCPDRPETKNGFQDDDGCPDTKTRDVELTAQAIRIKKSVYFAKDRDTILPNSFPILDSVADVLRDNPFITRVRVEGHTDSEGPNDFNLELSQRRAESVIAYLVEKGIAAERLEAKGYGEEKPIARNVTPGGRARNRRVEFKILSVYGTLLPDVEGGAKSK
jgi:outer membrane protein OmpA-like peptidoglycan-associated protein